MTVLLVDIGNTRLKWGLTEGSDIICGEPLVHDQSQQDALYTLWRIIPPPEYLAISCVSSVKTLKLVQSVAASLWPKTEIFQARSQASALGVRIAYEQPEKLGVDRWLAMIAVWQKYAGAACIVDCGTAITLDLLDNKGWHQGGLICPGLTLMKKSLAQGTDALSWVTENYPIAPANFTDAAIYSGTIYAAVGLIEHIMNKQSENRILVLTGGDAELIAEQLVYPATIDADLVLRGLAIFEKHSVANINNQP